MKYVLSIDQGTTSSRAVVFGKTGNVVSMAQKEFPQIYPEAGWVEHSPQDILGSVMAVCAESLARANLNAADLDSIGITNQRETCLVWDRKTGKPVYNAIVWQCRRTADFCRSLKSSCAEFIYGKTGLIPDAYFSATKLKWILENVNGARAKAERGELAFGTVDTFLLWHLTKGGTFATDYTNAARTMLFDIHNLRWDKELLRLFDIPENMLPEVKPSSADFGVTDSSVFGGSVPICGVAGDQQSALFGQLCTEVGDVKNTYGTGCFLLMNTGKTPVKSSNGLLTTLGACAEGKPGFVLEGSVFAGGAVVQWLRDGLKLISSADETEEIAKSCDNGGVYIVPAFTGLGAPYWDGAARGTITGITRGTTRENIVRAALESIAFQVADVVRAMERDAGVKIARLAVDGGASKNNFLLNFQAGILGCDILRPKTVETTALGAAFLAGLKTGYWSSVEELKSGIIVRDRFSCNMKKEERENLLENWQRAVRQTICR